MTGKKKKERKKDGKWLEITHLWGCNWSSQSIHFFYWKEKIKILKEIKKITINIYILLGKYHIQTWTPSFDPILIGLKEHEHEHEKYVRNKALTHQLEGFFSPSFGVMKLEFEVQQNKLAGSLECFLCFFWFALFLSMLCSMVSLLHQQWEWILGILVSYAKMVSFFLFIFFFFFFFQMNNTPGVRTILNN